MSLRIPEWMGKSIPPEEQNEDPIHKWFDFSGPAEGAPPSYDEIISKKVGDSWLDGLVCFGGRKPTTTAYARTTGAERV